MSKPTEQTTSTILEALRTGAATARAAFAVTLWPRWAVGYTAALTMLFALQMGGKL